MGGALGGALGALSGGGAKPAGRVHITVPGCPALDIASPFALEDCPGGRGDGTWVPAMLAVPGDALGLAAVPPVTAIMGPLTSPSLQISIEFAAPARGEWIGIDSRCHHCEGAIASGVATLWSADGTLVATVGQSALLRRIPG